MRVGTLLLSSFLSALFAINGASSRAEVPTSSITVPISADLDGLAHLINTQWLTSPLHQREYARNCVKAEELCTKVPEFRGLKVTMKNRCVQVTPSIDCTITEHASRVGPLTLTGSGNSLTATQVVDASASARGRGAIGKHIRQTVRAQAELAMTASPVLRNNWELDPNVSLSLRWLQRPEFNLFGLIPISIGSHVDGALNDALSKLEPETLPQTIHDADIKGQVADLWTQLQEPIPLKISPQHHAYLHIRPDAVGFSGLDFDHKTLDGALTIRLKAWMNEEETAGPALPLPNLSALSSDDVRLTIPLTISIETIEALIANQLPYLVDIPQLGGLSLWVRSVSASIEGDQLVLIPDAELRDATGETIISGQFKLLVTPSWNTATQTLTFSDIQPSLIEEGLWSYIANFAIRIGQMFISNTVDLALADDLSKVSEALNEALNRPLTRGLKLAGRAQIKIISIHANELNQSLELVTETLGDVQVMGFTIGN